ncbi:MAG: pyridoxamine 5'-phosphate oxidase family protein [Acidimicrobiales bacterium]
MLRGPVFGRAAPRLRHEPVPVMLSAMTDECRTRAQRRTDTLARLEVDEDIWVASASEGAPHLVPLSFAWDSTRIILGTPTRSPTARNASMTGVVRLALGPTRDVSVFDATADVVACADADAGIAEVFFGRVGWDPREEESEYSYVLAVPQVVRAWRNVPELNGRTIMRDGQWLEE